MHDPVGHGFHTGQVTVVIADKQISLREQIMIFFYTTQELTWFGKVCQQVTSHQRLLLGRVMLRLIM